MEMTVDLLQSIINTLTSVINISGLVGFIGAIIAVGAGFVLMWFAIRKALSAIMGGIKRGRVRV